MDYIDDITEHQEKFVNELLYGKPGDNQRKLLGRSFLEDLKDKRVLIIGTPLGSSSRWFRELCLQNGSKIEFKPVEEELRGFNLDWIEIDGELVDMVHPEKKLEKKNEEESMVGGVQQSVQLHEEDDGVRLEPLGSSGEGS